MQKKWGQSLKKTKNIVNNSNSCSLQSNNNCSHNGKRIKKTKLKLNEIYSKHTGKSEDEIKIALERDNFMTSENAREFGLIDQVVEKRS